MFRLLRDNLESFFFNEHQVVKTNSQMTSTSNLPISCFHRAKCQPARAQRWSKLSLERLKRSLEGRKLASVLISSDHGRFARIISPAFNCAGGDGAAASYIDARTTNYPDGFPSNSWMDDQKGVGRWIQRDDLAIGNGTVELHPSHVCVSSSWNVSMRWWLLPIIELAKESPLLQAAYLPRVASFMQVGVNITFATCTGHG
jgi:hypothetical protein